MSGLIRREWESFREQAVDAEASPAQVAEVQRAFYGGALALYAIVMRELSPGPDPTPADDAMMAAIAEELAAFGRRHGAAS